MQVQRDLLVQDVVHPDGRCFDGSRLGGVVAGSTKLFTGRFDALISSYSWSRPPRGGNGPVGGHGGPAQAATCTETASQRRLESGQEMKKSPCRQPTGLLFGTRSGRRQASAEVTRCP